MRKVAWLSVLLGGCVIGGGERSWVFDGATGLRVELASGSILVGPSMDDQLRLAFDGGGVGQPAHPDAVQASDGFVSLLASDGLGGGDVDARVPGGIPIEAFLDQGDITVELAEPADVVLCVAAGSVTLVVPPGRYDLDLDIGAGSISQGVVDDPSAPYRLSVCAGAGDLSVSTGVVESTSTADGG
ncbi:MAG: hypothetical protein KC656_10520 [Myxococcales bacterium]|nr:hypothetical protein [Myxococcales bacterium]MCA9568270.1 hypothetical protein [Myxococcales bacterium]